MGSMHVGHSTCPTSDASGTLAGKSLTNSRNILMKLLEIGP